uniref:cGMP-dependent protein kinase n=1 Tax=Takifugu rubripes TaxID=31033 RepID=A0A674P6R0_TAKRU
MNNDFLNKLEPQHMNQMVDCMFENVYTEGQLVIREGEPGNYLYVLSEGLLEVIQNGKLLGEMHAGTAFGELAILYNCKRTATVKALSEAHIWALDRQMFQTIMRQTTQARHEEYFSFLRSVSLLQGLPEQKLAKIVDCLEVDYFEKGEYIIREGEEGNTFFIISKGESNDKRNLSKNVFEKDFSFIKTLIFFIISSLRLHSPQMDSAEAQQHRRLMERVALLSAHRPFQHLDIIATLGMGGFGRVELVKLKDEDVTFALKCIKKKHIVDTRQQEHIYSEKTILQQTNSAFIIRFFRTFRDDKFVYMLLEACLGGELWSLLRDMSYFDDPTAMFCTGCVLEAFDYLHAMGIVYRDLKPENLLLDARGYVKLADFGFAKKIGLGKKTWTFCGTPEYVAPEVIMNKGHDFGADCWALGVLIFELLTGNPLFLGSDPIKIYTMVLHGIDKMDFPKKIGKRPDDLIRRLCKLNPAERLGNKKNGIGEIKKTKVSQLTRVTIFTNNYFYM